MTQVTTAAALAMFRDELIARGFPATLVDQLVVEAVDAELRSTNGLTVEHQPPPNVATPETE